MPAAEVVGPGVDSKSLELLTRAILGPAPILNPESSHLLVTIHGPDKAGIIRDVSSALYSHGASISHSKMMTLAADFAIVMHVECDPSKVSDVRMALSSAPLANLGLDISVRSVQPRQRLKPTFTGQVSLTGLDRPGLLYHLSDVLAGQGLNIDHLQTEQHRMPSPESPALFTTHCHVCGDTRPDIDTLRDQLKSLEADLGVHCNIQVVSNDR